jgi:hypothetical protein
LHEEAITEITSNLDITKQTYQDGRNVWYFKKLAELELRIEYLERIENLKMF